MTVSGESFARTRQAVQLRWLLIAATVIVCVALVLTALDVAPRPFLVYEVAVLLSIGVAFVLLRRRRQIAGTVVFLMGWTLFVIATAVSPMADAVSLLILPYFLLPVILIAGTLIAPAASLGALGVLTVLYLGAIMLRGGPGTMDLAETPYSDALFLVLAFYGGVLLAVLSWHSGRFMAAAVQRADESAEALSRELALVETMVSESLIAATRVAALSERISASAAVIGDGATMIATASDRVAAGVRDQGRQTAEVSRAASALATTTQEIAEASVEVSDAALDSEGRAESAATTLAALRRQLTAIEKVVALVDKVADRTQLVAINAAIEASRAGEAGVGFAVVAEEVQRLSEQSAASAREIGKISRQVRESLSPVLENMAAVQSGTRHSYRLVQRVAELAAEQRDGYAAMLDAVTRIAHVADANATAAQGITTSVGHQSSSVTDTMDAIKDLVDVSRALQAAIADRIDEAAGLCPNIINCPIFEVLCCGELGESYLTQFCMGRYVDCERKRLREAGGEVPLVLMPDGTRVEWGTL